MRARRRPTRPGERSEPAVETEVPAGENPGRLRGTLPELLIVLGLTGALLFGITRYALGLYFRTAGIRPGVRFLGVEVGGLGKVEAKQNIEGAIQSCFRFPLLLELGETVYFLYLRDHFKIEVDQEALIAQARSLEQDEDIWQRAERYMKADFRPVELPWAPVLDREYSRTAVAKLIEDRTESRVHAFQLEDGTIKVVVSNPADQVEAILDQIEKVVKESPMPARRVIRPKITLGGDDEYVVAPDDPERGFRFPLAHCEIALPTEDPIEAMNIARGLEKVHAYILNPGEELSFSELAGPFTTEEGYQGRIPPAVELPVHMTTLATPPDWMEGEPLPPTTASSGPIQIATGVERLATAVFQALIRAGANVISRSTHVHFSKDLAYTPLALDVRILPDEELPPGELVLKNRWDFPLRLLGSMSPEAVRIDVFALNEPPSEVEIRVGVPEKIPYKTELVRDPMIPRGEERVERQGLDGFRVKVFRKLVRKDGLPTQEHMLGEPIDYAPRAGRIVLGTGDPRRLRELERQRQSERMLRWMDSGMDGF